MLPQLIEHLIPTPAPLPPLQQPKRPRMELRLYSHSRDSSVHIVVEVITPEIDRSSPVHVIIVEILGTRFTITGQRQGLHPQHF